MSDPRMPCLAVTWVLPWSCADGHTLLGLAFLRCVGEIRLLEWTHLLASAQGIPRTWQVDSLDAQVLILSGFPTMSIYRVRWEHACMLLPLAGPLRSRIEAASFNTGDAFTSCLCYRHTLQRMPTSVWNNSVNFSDWI